MVQEWSEPVCRGQERDNITEKVLLSRSTSDLTMFLKV